MVPTDGIEPPSMILQTTAMTTSAKLAIDTLLISLYAECHGDIGFASIGTSLISQHFTLDTKPAGLEVRSYSCHLFATRVIIPNSHSFRGYAFSTSTLAKMVPRVRLELTYSHL